MLAFGRGATDGKTPIISFASSYVIKEGAMVECTLALMGVLGFICFELLTTVEQTNRCKLIQMLLVIYGYTTRP